MKLPKDSFFSIRAPVNLYNDMLRDVEVLYRQPAFTSCLTLIACFIDALGAGSGGADKAKFVAFMERHFRGLCDELGTAVPGKPGAVTFYQEFRNGLAHLRGPKSGYALARDNETGGAYVEVFDVDQHGRYVGVNVDRLYTEFMALVRKLGSGTT